MAREIVCPQCGAAQKVPTLGATVVHCEICDAAIPVPLGSARELGGPGADSETPEFPQPDYSAGRGQPINVSLSRPLGCLAVGGCLIPLLMTIALLAAAKQIWWPIGALAIFPATFGFVMLLIIGAPMLMAWRLKRAMRGGFARRPFDSPYSAEDRHPPGRGDDARLN